MPPAAASAIGKDADGGLSALWTEVEIAAIMTEVQTRKSVDTFKLFGGPNGSLPPLLSARTSAEVKARVDHCKCSFDSTAIPWTPKCGVPELLAVLASEVSFIRQQRARRDGADVALVNAKKARDDEEARWREGRKAMREVWGRLREVSEGRGVGRGLRAIEITRFNDEKDLLDAERTEREKAEDELHGAKLAEMDSRRRLDRCRLKAAAIRGDMVSGTMDELVRPSLRRGEREMEVGEIVDAAAAVTILEGEDVDEDVEEDDVDENDDAGSGEIERNGTGDKSRTAEISGTGGSGMADVDKADVMSERTTGGGEELEGRTPRSRAIADVDMDAAIISWERGEGKSGEEVRLLQNRLAMHMAEAAEWKVSSDAERLRAKLLTIARTRLEGLLPPVSTGKVAPPKAGSKRGAVVMEAAAAAAVATVDVVGTVEDGGRRKRRKGVARRAVFLLPHSSHA